MTTTAVLAGIAQAVTDGRVTAARAEMLMGFVQARALDLAPPSGATWRRRCSELKRLGLPTPVPPTRLEDDEAGDVKRRRWTVQGWGDALPQAG